MQGAKSRTSHSSTTLDDLAPRRRIIVLGGLAVVALVIGGVGAVAIDLLIGPMMTEFRWANSVASSAATVFNLSGLLAAPAVGLALERFGARSCMSVGVVLSAVGFLAVSHCHSVVSMVVAFGIIGVGYAASFYVPSAVVVESWMGASQKSWGMGIVMAAMSVGAALFSLLLGRWVDAYGWRFANELIAAVFILLLPLPALVISVRHRTTDVGGGQNSVQSSSAHRSNMFSKVFLVVTAASGFFAVGMMGVYYHVVSVLTNAGYSTHWAGFAFGLSWIASAMGSLVWADIAGRSGTKNALTLGLLLCACGTLFLLGASASRVGISCVVLFIVLWGGSANSLVQFVPLIFSERLGSHHLGVLVGIQASVMGLVGAGAPIITGALYDRFSDYRLAILLSSGAMLIAGALVSLVDLANRADQARALRGPHPAV
jgi:MFS family permease